LRLGLYNPTTFERLTTANGEDYFLVGEIRVNNK
jgi:hypothetical protein